MAIHTKLTVRDGAPAPAAPSGGGAPAKPQRSEEERAARKARVEGAKDALKRSANLRGDHVPPARAALKSFLQNLNEPRQPNEETFQAMLEAPFKAPPKKRERR